MKEIIIDFINNLANNIFQLCQYSIKRRIIKKELIENVILYRFCLQYLPEDYDFDDIKRTEMIFSEYIRVYLGKNFYNAYVDNSTNIFWAVRYTSKITLEIIERSLKDFINLAKSKKLLGKDI